MAGSPVPLSACYSAYALGWCGHRGSPTDQWLGIYHLLLVEDIGRGKYVPWDECKQQQYISGDDGSCIAGGWLFMVGGGDDRERERAIPITHYYRFKVTYLRHNILSME